MDGTPQNRTKKRRDLRSVLVLLQMRLTRRLKTPNRHLFNSTSVRAVRKATRDRIGARKA